MHNPQQLTPQKPITVTDVLNTICNPEYQGFGVPRNRLLTNPNINNARTVTTRDMYKAIIASENIMYGIKGINPPNK
jgi:hypothetical protein